MKSLLFVALIVAAVSAGIPHPAVGILTKPLDDNDPKKGSFIGATIVRYLEAQGLYVVPLFYDDSAAATREKLSHLDGVLFSGGGVPLIKGTPYYETAKIAYEYALSEGVAGRPFPVFGVCLGFELLSILAADDESVLETGFDSYDLALPLVFTQEATKSKLFGDMNKDLWSQLANQNITLNDHECGFTPSKFVANKKLSAAYTVLSTNVDRKGRPFVSSFEAKDAAKTPIFGLQWHPECASWLCFGNRETFNSAGGVYAAQWVMRPFAEAARRHPNAYPSKAVLYKERIENYPVTYDVDEGDSTWYFDPRN